ncbi:hypothetical protein AeMF1_001130 [Aphanomyces euteiches]|nr:hypothetical protein AeMF1_001130 [Aphanomyces euteiches]
MRATSDQRILLCQFDLDSPQNAIFQFVSSMLKAAKALLSSSSSHANDVGELTATSSNGSHTSLVVQHNATIRAVNLAFLMDTTGSMGPHMKAVKTQIEQITASFKRLGLSMRVAFVGYKDHCDGPDHFNVLPFTDDIAYFQQFVKKIPAKGGGDAPEDVLGGLLACVNQLAWPKNATNVLFHLGDAPPHGRQYHNDRDSFPNGHELDKPIETIFDSLHAMAIQYYFGKVNTATDAMIDKFRAVCRSPMTVFDVRNPVHIQTSVISAALSSTPTSSRSSQRPLPIRRDFVFCSEMPQWDEMPLRRGALLSYAEPASLEELLAGNDPTKHLRPTSLRIAPQPFAYGSERVVHYAQEYHKRSKSSESMSSSQQSCSSSVSSGCSWIDVGENAFEYEVEAMVAKAFVYNTSNNSGGQAEGQRYLKAMEGHVAAAFLARLFNKALHGPHQLAFLRSKVVRLGTSEPYEFFAWEKHFKAATPPVKLTNNLGFIVADEEDASMADIVAFASAFSHWTWHVTKGALVVVNLQGQIEGSAASSRLVLTDPTIHSVDADRFDQGTNFGARGIAAFFETHHCNSYCATLELDRA